MLDAQAGSSLSITNCNFTHGGSATDAMVHIETPDVTIQDTYFEVLDGAAVKVFNTTEFTIIGSEFAVHPSTSPQEILDIFGSKNVTITNNVLSGGERGIEVSDKASNITIFNNTIHSNSNAIRIEKPINENFTISRNTLSTSTSACIWVSASTFTGLPKVSMISDNYIKASEIYGMDLHNTFGKPVKVLADTHIQADVIVLNVFREIVKFSLVGFSIRIALLFE